MNGWNLFCIIGRPDSRAAQRLAKDLRDGVSRARSSLSMDYADRNQDFQGTVVNCIEACLID